MMKDVDLKVNGLTLKGQLFLPEGKVAPYPAVILCHGVPTGVADPSDGGYPALARTICAEGFEVFIFNFRGTGASEGNFDILGWTHDLEAAVDYIWGLEETDCRSLSLVGFSAGAAVSIFVAAQDKRISAVAACACPADFRSISDSEDPQKVFNYFRKIGILRDPGYPPSVEKWLKSFRKVSALQSVSGLSPRPLLLVHGAMDSVVPVDNSRRLYEKAGQPKQIIILETAEHRLRRCEDAVSAILKWLKRESLPDSKLN